jgi:hypothetical protein
MVFTFSKGVSSINATGSHGNFTLGRCLQTLGLRHQHILCVYFQASLLTMPNRFSVFLFMVFMFSTQNYHHQHRPEAHVSHAISIPPIFLALSYQHILK